MSSSFLHFDLRLVSPDFNSNLTSVVMELNHLRRLKLSGTTRPWVFFQLKNIFHILESLGSARIEGNRTTISEYIEQKIENQERSNENFSEISNVENAMRFIEESITEGSEITNHFIRELHQKVVADLSGEGDRTPGKFREWEVNITGSDHKPPGHATVQSYMDELIEFINKKDTEQFDLIKIALAHHRFAWIHPFGNGNGRVVRLLTYTMLIKYGFNVTNGQILNPTAVFCNDRDLYYKKLSDADKGEEQSLLNWCEYVLAGVLEEIEKINKLLDYDYLLPSILIPTIEHGLERGYLNKTEYEILVTCLKKQRLKASDIKKSTLTLTQRQRTHQITKMKNAGLLKPFEENGRTYHINFTNNYLMRSLFRVLEQEHFIPLID